MTQAFTTRFVMGECLLVLSFWKYSTRAWSWDIASSHNHHSYSALHSIVSHFLLSFSSSLSLRSNTITDGSNPWHSVAASQIFVASSFSPQLPACCIPLCSNNITCLPIPQCIGWKSRPFPSSLPFTIWSLRLWIPGSLWVESCPTSSYSNSWNKPLSFPASFLLTAESSWTHV